METLSDSENMTLQAVKTTDFNHQVNDFFLQIKRQDVSLVIRSQNNTYNFLI